MNNLSTVIEQALDTDAAQVGQTLSGDLDQDSDGYTFKYLVATNRLPLLRANLARINRKALKHGVAPFEIKLGRTGSEFIEDRSEGRAATIDWVEVQITGKPFALGHYKIGALIDHRENTYQAVGNFQIPGKYIGCDPHCDHCKTKRDRAKTFLLYDRDGNLTMVGKSCVEAYTGTAPEHALAATSIYTEFAAQMQEYEGERYREGAAFEPSFPMLPYLALVAHQIRTAGWVSKGTAASNRSEGIHPDISTADAALDTLTKIARNSEGTWTLDSIDATDEDREMAHATLQHARDKFADVPSRDLVDAFEATLWSITQRDQFLQKHAGQTAFTVRMYIRDVIEPQVQASLAVDSTYIGTEKKREEFTVTVHKLIPIQGAFGMKLICLMADDKGNQLRWVNSGQNELEAGRTYVVKATVKKHEEYKGVKQTHLSRVALMHELTAEAEAQPLPKEATPDDSASPEL